MTGQPAPAVEHSPLMHRVGASDKRLTYQGRCSCGWESEWHLSANAADTAVAGHLEAMRRPL